MSNVKKSRGTNCRIDCPGRAVSGRSTKKHDSRNQRRRHQFRRKRQNLVYNPEEEIWNEPYMQPLREELLSQVSILCDSKIELPWKDIAVTFAGGSKRPEVDGEMKDNEKLTEKESTALMKLPWSDLLIEEIVTSVCTRKNEPVTCDSSLEIPWDDLIIEKSVKIASSPLEKPCPLEDIEIPWDAILVPRNIIIESKTRKHPSSSVSSRKGDKRAEQRCCRLACRARNI